MGRLLGLRSVRREFPHHLTRQQVDQPKNGNINLRIGSLGAKGNGGNACHGAIIAVRRKQFEVYRLKFFYLIDTLI